MKYEYIEIDMMVSIKANRYLLDNLSNHKALMNKNLNLIKIQDEYLYNPHYTSLFLLTLRYKLHFYLINTVNLF